MKIGYYVQGSTDEALVHGLAARWCPDAELAPGKFRGSSRLSFRREIENALLDLRDDKKCDVLVILTDADVNRWQDVKRQESNRIPADCQHLSAFGVADRNIECWLALDRQALAREIGSRESDLEVDDPKGVVENGFGYGRRDIDDVKRQISEFVRQAPLKNWIHHGDSFADFYDEVRSLAGRTGCDIPNEREAAG